MDHMGSQNGMDELDLIDADSQKISAMLGALPRVDAPANFEFRVKAGIAAGKPRRFAFSPILKTAAPLALIVVGVASGVLYYEQPSTTDVGPVDSLAMSQPVMPTSKLEPEPIQAASAAAPQASAPASILPSDGVATVRRPKQIQRTNTPAINSDEGSSVDRVIHPATVIMPKGLESANPQKRNANMDSSSSTDTPVRDVLGMFGLEGEFANGGWKVRSVKENSIGARAKIAAGDVIESIDGRQVTSDSKLKGGVKTFTVRRDGKSITLSN